MRRQNDYQIISESIPRVTNEDLTEGGNPGGEDSATLGINERQFAKSLIC